MKAKPLQHVPLLLLGLILAAPSNTPDSHWGSDFSSAYAQSSQISRVTAKWEPVINATNVDTDELFPSQILALARYQPSRQVRPTYLGDPNGVLGVKILNPEAGARVRVSVGVDHLAAESTYDGTLPEENEWYEVWPTIQFDTPSLVHMREPFPTTAVFSVWVNDTFVGRQTRSIRVRSVNDVPLSFRARDGSTINTSYLFAAFVDENHPWIDSLLAEAIKTQSIRSFVGYQGSSNEVLHQLFAVWNVLQRSQVRYSNITAPSGESQVVVSQHVRFLDEAMKSSQANCVDGTVLFASVLYKLGIRPILVVVPGHMFLGFYLDGQPFNGRNMAFLETTTIGNPGLNVLQREWKFLNPDSSYLSSESYRQFLAAIQSGQEEAQHAWGSLTTHKPGYFLIDVAKARRAGISPVPRF